MEYHRCDDITGFVTLAHCVWVQDFPHQPCGRQWGRALQIGGSPTPNWEMVFLQLSHGVDYLPVAGSCIIPCVVELSQHHNLYIKHFLLFQWNLGWNSQLEVCFS